MDKYYFVKCLCCEHICVCVLSHSKKKKKVYKSIYQIDYYFMFTSGDPTPTSTELTGNYFFFLNFLLTTKKFFLILPANLTPSNFNLLVFDVKQNFSFSFEKKKNNSYYALPYCYPFSHY